MLTPALRISLAPTPADLCGTPASPWTVNDQREYSQPTLDSTLDLAKLSVKQQVDALISSPLLARIAEELDRAHGRGHRLFPTGLMFLLVALSRGLISERELCRKLSVSAGDDLWTYTRDRWAAVHGQILPARAPAREDLRRFRRWATRPDTLRALLDVFQTASLELARQLGAFAHRPRADLADAWVHNVLIGDGTVTTRYSKLEEVRLPDGSTVIYGSRATDASRQGHRLQRRSTDNSEDGKGDLYGINTTHLGVMTPAGYLVLAVGQVDRSEGTVALDLIDELMQQLPPTAVHAIVYDRALTGWHADYLLGRYGIPLIGKASPSSLAKKTAPRHVQDAWKTSRTAQKKGKAAQAKARDRSVGKLGRTERDAAAEQALIAAFTGQTCLGQDLGLTVHRDSRGVPQIVYSAYAQLGTAAHHTATGWCVHRLVVDDNTLTVLDEHGRKQQQPVLIRSRADLGETGFTITATWQLRCDHGDFEHTETWAPRTDRCPLPEPERKKATARQKALTLLRLIPQPDPRWATLAGLRNQAESWHNTYKKSLPNKRATSPSGEEQLLQYIGAALLYNAERWRRHQTGERHRQDQ